MANENVNIGIVGLGFMAVMHIRAYRQVEGANIAAICNPSGNRLNGDFSDVFGNLDSGDPVKLDMSQVKAYQSFDELIADCFMPQLNADFPPTTGDEGEAQQ